MNNWNKLLGLEVWLQNAAEYNFTKLSWFVNNYLLPKQPIHAYNAVNQVQSDRNSNPNGFEAVNQGILRSIWIWKYWFHRLCRIVKIILLYVLLLANKTWKLAVRTAVWIVNESGGWNCAWKVFTLNFCIYFSTKVVINNYADMQGQA